MMSKGLNGFVFGILVSLYFICYLFDEYRDEIIDDYYLDIFYKEYIDIYNVIVPIIIIATVFQALMILWDVIEKLRNN